MTRLKECYIVSKVTRSHADDWQSEKNKSHESQSRTKEVLIPKLASINLVPALAPSIVLVAAKVDVPGLLASSLPGSTVNAAAVALVDALHNQLPCSVGLCLSTYRVAVPVGVGLVGAPEGAGSLGKILPV